MGETTWHLSFCAWSVSLSMMTAHSLCIVTQDRISFFFNQLEGCSVCICTTFSLCVHLLKDVCFRFLSIVHSAAVNTGVQVSLYNVDFISFEWKSVAGLLVCTRLVFLVCWSVSMLFLKFAFLSMCTGTPFSHIHTSTVILIFFWISIVPEVILTVILMWISPLSPLSS